METKLKAKDIYNYFLDYFNPDFFISEEKKKEMIKEIEFMIDNN